MSASAYSDFPAIIQEYLFYSETIKNRSPVTVSEYALDLRTFFRFIKQHRNLVSAEVEFQDISISDIDLEFVNSVSTMDIYAYLHYAARTRNNSPTTRARKLSSIRSFFSYLAVKANRITENPAQNIELPSTKRALPRFLSLEESISLLHAVDGANRERDYCIITLFLNCGMRLSELVGINCGDIHKDNVRILGKGNKERMVFLNDACLAAIQAYLPERERKLPKGKEEPALFLNRNGGRIGVRRVQKIIEETLQRSGLSGRGFSPHKLRHTAATLMYRHGNADILALKEILGHEHVTTTEIYTHIAGDQLKKVMDTSPLAHIQPPSKKKKAPKTKEDPEDADS